MKARDSGDKQLNVYLIYYLSSLMINALIVSLYSVYTFKDSPACLSRNHTNLTEIFENAFFGGFLLQIANFSYFAFGEPLEYQLHHKVKEKTRKIELLLSMHRIV